MKSVTEKIAAYEKQFSKRNYRGGGKEDFVIKGGGIPIMISAPHAVNHFREGGVLNAEIYTGGIAKYLHEVTRCHMIYLARYSKVDPNYDEGREGSYKEVLKKYVQEHGIKVLVDLHGCTEDHEMAVDIGTVDDTNISLKRYPFVGKLFQYALEYWLADSIGQGRKCVTVNGRFSAGQTNTITRYISQTTDTSCIQLEINRICREMGQADVLEKTVQALSDAINLLAAADWGAEGLYVFKAQRTRRQFPQDKVQFIDSAPIPFREVLVLRAGGQSMQQAMRYQSPDKQPPDHQSTDSVYEKGNIYLTNRLIGALFPEEADKDTFVNKPVLLHICKKKKLGIGRPVVEERSISLSENVYRELVSEEQEYILYNKYSNTKYYLKLRNYGGKSDDMVYMPYYYRMLLLAEYPLQEIQAEGYGQLLEKAEEGEKECLERSYKLDVWKGIYVLQGNIQEEQLSTLKELEKRVIGYNPIELLRVPGGGRGHRRFWKEWKERIAEFLLNLYVGCTAYELRVCRPMAMDDQNNTARLSTNMMQILGVVPNDKLQIRFGGRQVTLRVLEMDADTSSDMLIGLPAKARKELGICGINDVVEVKRNMAHIFLRNMSQQVFAVLGSVLTVTALSDNTVFQIAAGIVLAPIAVYLVMSEERLCVRKNPKDGSP